MKRIYLFLLLFFTGGICSGQSPAPGSGISPEDYRRAESFLANNISRKIYHLEVNPNWLKDVPEFTYATNTPRGKTFYKVHIPSGTIKEAFDHERLARALSDALGKPIERKNLPFGQIEWENDRAISFITDRVTYQANLKDYTVNKTGVLPAEEVSVREVRSPDGKWVAFSRDHNLYVRSQAQEIALSTDGKPDYAYASYLGWSDIMEGENGERPENFTAVWSADGSRILTQIADLRKGRKMYLLDWSIDSLYRPKLLSYYRGGPGDTNIVCYIPVIFDINTRKMIKVDLPPLPHFIGNPLRWNKDGSFLYGLYRHRGYQRMDLICVDPRTGKVDVKFSDSSRTNVENTTEFRLLEDKGIAFITSERSGWNQVYRLDWASGSVTALTRGDFVVKKFVAIDEEKELLYFTASGKEEGRNPYFNHLYRIGFDGSGLQLLTPENAHHEVHLSPGNQYFVDNYSTARQPTISVLRSLPDGKMIKELGKADISELLAAGWDFPEIFKVKARDGLTDIYGAIWKPSGFSESDRYPLIDNSYTGPQANVFPESFRSAVFSAAQPLAEFGFAVMAVDGLGSAGRSKAFHDWSYKRLGYGLTDHVVAIRQLAAKYSWLDTTRIGIFGHSAGGYDAAHALMLFSGFYKVAVASSGDHDHRMEKAWWPEMYMGWPVDSAYHLQSNITMADKMQGKLLLVHGGIDENVNPSATFKLAEALIRAGKNFDMLIIPGSGHGYTGHYGEYFTRKRWNYFIEHLLGKQALP
ncbi:prolyl oligopeptidase family protein [Anseongella ginsenosidimutans]|uniref:Prolyl oligopeptidase family protein n=2 Tax=Anseongella ginsenosidimutans TaxID=496056 RepID=A0A4R3KWC1_9SPHI|nr:prolyl oligopeptidase family serine peptidase [Anseongella ginsenosidimutans]TCS90059.1 prolyl oligopeptidase family protein [Anseongella ginsenosidimutans]